jgi:hypothetical protein
MAAMWRPSLCHGVVLAGWLMACGGDGSAKLPPRPVIPTVDRFTDTFDDLGPGPEVAGSPGVPRALFADDLSRWDQLQNTDPGTNTLAVVEARGGRALSAFAVGKPGEQASKMGLGKQTQLSFGRGDVVRVSARFFADGATMTPFVGSTLIDLEDSDDLFINGDASGAGLRVRITDTGRVQLDRGELIGSDDGVAAPQFRLSNFTNEATFPVDRWVTLEAVVKLGTGVPRSTRGPIDDTFDAATTEAWCELFVTVETGARELVLRQRGTTWLDREVGAPLLERAGVSWAWREAYDYNSVQFGLTNNRSQRDQRLQFDDVLVEKLSGP